MDLDLNDKLNIAAVLIVFGLAISLLMVYCLLTAGKNREEHESNYYTPERDTNEDSQSGR